MIKAIETHYRGYRFRSRLEARWAVFFDILGIDWEYEKEGLDLDGVWYLPDFWLPHMETWIEIKPKIYIPGGDWPDHLMFDYINGQDMNSDIPDFILLSGNPWVDLEYVRTEEIEIKRQKYTRYYVTQEVGYDYQGFVSFDHRYYWCECPVCGEIGIEYEGRSARLCDCIDSDRVHNDASPKLIMAYTAARGARFEHGERPYANFNKVGW
jgi:hypothetical protein